jgi:hypothetical protein
VLVNATRFRAAHEGRLASARPARDAHRKAFVGALSEDDLLALPLLYRSALSSLSVARETSLDRALIGYLEQLCTRAYFQTLRRADIGNAGSWRGSSRAAGPWRCRHCGGDAVALFLMLAGALAAYLLVHANPSWFYTLMPDSLAQGRDPTASAQTLSKTIYAREESAMQGTVFATALFTHNSQIAIFAFALGVAFCRADRIADRL